MEAGQPITPLHLMLGRATVDVLWVCSDGPVSATHRMQFLRDLRNQYWNKFKAMVFQGLDRSHKWRSDMRDFQQGDIVLLKQETTATAIYRLGLVGDSKVRRVLVKYKKGYRVSERHANKLVLIVPVDELSIREGANTLEQVPPAQDNSEQVPPVQDNSEQVPPAQDNYEQVPFAQDNEGGKMFQASRCVSSQEKRRRC